MNYCHCIVLWSNFLFSRNIKNNLKHDVDRHLLVGESYNLYFVELYNEKWVKCRQVGGFGKWLELE